MPKRGPLRNAKGGKRKAAGAEPTAKSKPSQFDLKWDEDLQSSDDSDTEQLQKKARKATPAEDDDDDDLEPEQRRKQLAYQYLKSMKDDSDSEAGSLGSADMTERLRRERLESQGMYFRDLSSQLDGLSIANTEKIVLGSHEHSVTCVALTSDDGTVYSGSKDNSVIRWDLEVGGASKIVLRPRWNRKSHPDVQSSSGEVLAVAVTTDGKYLASAGRDCLVRIYDTRINQEIKSFQGHRDAVTSLAFRRESNSLFSGSLDRCIKHWDLNEMGYLETAFGHQDGIYGMDCWHKDRPASASADKSIRLWKISEDTHLVFRGHKGSVDAIQIITADSAISGGADGNLCLWKETQKKPVAQVHAAHGFDGDELHSAFSINPRWITSLASVKMSNLAASGSNDGYIKLWNTSAEDRELSEIGRIACDGFVNGLALSTKFVVAGTGNEHRLGRWWRMKGALNKVIIYKLPVDLDEGDRISHKLRSDIDDKSEDESVDSDNDSNSVSEDSS